MHVHTHILIFNPKSKTKIALKTFQRSILGASMELLSSIRMDPGTEAFVQGKKEKSWKRVSFLCSALSHSQCHLGS